MIRRRRHAHVVRRLERLRAPDELASEERAWPAVRTAYAQRLPVPRRRSRRRFALAPIPLVIAAAFALTPAGAAVHRLIEGAPGVPHASVRLSSLPAPGRLLVSGSAGAWILNADGSKHRLGRWQQASWSPRGLYIAVARSDRVTAVDPAGKPYWTVSHPGVRDPRWFWPSGYRVAYLSGNDLRAVAGDGTGDRLLAARVRQVAPAWRPAHPYQLAYVSLTGEVVARDADSGRVLWSRRLGRVPTLLSWSAAGSRLAAVTGTSATVLDGAGHVVARIGIGGRAVDAALSPDGASLAILTASELTVTSLAPPAQPSRRLFTGSGLRQLEWSPDGQWVLVTWPAADQWIFVRASDRPGIAAFSRIAEQFGGSFPQVDGWCCVAGGA